MAPTSMLVTVLGSKFAKIDIFHLFGKILVFVSKFPKKWLLWTKILRWICHIVSFSRGVRMDPYKTPEGPKLANLGVVVVLRVINENLSQKRESN